MSLVFISYRRSDSPDSVARIAKGLESRLPNWEVFYDHTSIPLGEKFPDLLRAKVTSATVVLVVIGPKWLESLKQRANDPVDFVREEVRLALQAGHTVLPVPVFGGRIPSEVDLADFPELQPLLTLNGRGIRPDPDFDSDLDRIAGFLEKIGPGESIGTILAGKYKLARLIGEGGMGIVYAAEQREPKRTVAIKLIKLGMDSKEVLARFDAERQALAVMDHPNIAKVLDAGTASSGRPFFAMEYVRGVPITDYCDAKKLSPNERLELFKQVCQAVQHAHQKGIVHRDLKPSNVLVEEVDRRAVPKVIDFGLAKALGQRLTDKTLHTAFETRLGTLEYSSPEQAAGMQFVDTRTDIYSLGVLLYELLTGHLPFARDELLRIGEEAMRRVIRDIAPTKPSAKLSSSNALPSIAANRKSEPAKLTKLVRGELDWIVMKSLEKEPNRRYDTATAFADDVEHYLQHEPVSAGKPSSLYRFNKFMRRNRGPVLAASLVFLALLAGVVGTAIGLLKARDQEQLARGETEEKELARAAEETQKKIAQASNVQASAALKDREEALATADARAKELKYQLGIGNFMLAKVAYDNGDMVLARERLEKVPPDQRKWEWGYLRRQAQGGLFTLYGHTGAVTDVAWSPDGRRLATASADGTARLWDARTGYSQLILRGHTGGVTKIAFSPDGTRVITGSEDSTARLWEVRTGKLLRTLTGHIKRVSSVAFSPDGSQVLTGSVDETSRLWDAQTGKMLLFLNGFTGGVSKVTFSPDGSRLFIGSKQGLVKTWDARTGLRKFESKTVNGDTGVVFSPKGDWIVQELAIYRKEPVAKAFLDSIDYDGLTAFSPDDSQFLALGWGVARVADGQTNRSLFEFRGHSGWVTSAAFSPDGSFVITGEGCTARVWDARSFNAWIQHDDLDGPVSHITSLDFSPDGSRLITNGSDVAHIWDAKSGSLLLDLKGHASWVTSVTFSADGLSVLTGSNDETARVWDARSGKTLLELKGHSGRVACVAYSPNMTRLVTCPWDEEIAHVWDARSGRLLFDLKGGARCVAFSPDGSRILTSGRDTAAQVWETATGKALLRLNGSEKVGSLAYNPDGDRIVTGHQDNIGRVWDANSGSLLLELKGHTLEIQAVAYSPDGARIVTGGTDRTVRIWEARTGDPLLELKGHHDSITSVAFSPDCLRIVTGSLDGRVQMWDARPIGQGRGKLLHSEVVEGVAVSPDGRYILTGTTRNAYLWDAQTGRRVHELGGKGGTLERVSFSIDGTRLITHRNYVTTVWDSTTGKELVGEKPPVDLYSSRLSPDGHLFVYADGNYVEWISLDWDAAEHAARRHDTRASIPHHYSERNLAADDFSANFHRDRLLAYDVSNRLRWLEERNMIEGKPTLITRTAFHTPSLEKTPYDGETIRLLAINGDRLALRIVAQELIREEQPAKAVPLLHATMIRRPLNSPPVEEFLICSALIKLNRIDDARNYYRAAADWLDQPRNPMRAANVLTHAFNPWSAIGEAFKPIDDPRHNPFDWESWHESEVFRAEVEKALAGR